MSEPVEIVSERLGRLLVSAWNVGAIMAVSEAKLAAIDGPDFVRGFFAELSRLVPVGIPVSDEAYEQGRRIPRSEFDRLADEEIELLATAYLSGDDGYLRDEGGEAAHEDEAATARLRRLAVSSVTTLEEGSKRIAEKFAGLTLSPALRTSLERTAGIATRLSGIVPKNPMGLAALGRTPGMLAIGEALAAARGMPSLAASSAERLAPGEALERSSLKVPPLRLPPNPAYETNSLLAGVSEGIAQLRGDIAEMLAISQQQRLLVEALSETATLALGEAASSSADAKRSAELAERSTALTKHSVLVAVAAILISCAISWFAISDARRIAAENDVSTRELIQAVREGTRVGAEVREGITEQSRLAKELVEAHSASSKEIRAAVGALVPPPAGTR